MNAICTGTVTLKRATVILATVLLASCGVNYGTFIHFVPLNNSEPGPHIWSGGILSATATFEIIGVVVATLGLAVVAGIAICRAARRHFRELLSKGTSGVS